MSSNSEDATAHTTNVHLPTERRRTTHRKAVPLRRKLIFWNVIVLFFTLFLLSGVVFILISYFLTSNVNQQLGDLGTQLQQTTDTCLASQKTLDNTCLNQIVRVGQGDEFSANPVYVKLINVHNGTLLMRSPSLGQVRLPFNQQDFESALHGQQVLNTYTDNIGRKVRILTLPLYNTTGHILVIGQVSISLEEIQHVQTLLFVLLSVGDLFATAIAYVVSMLLIDHEIRPLRALSMTMRNLSTSSLGIHFSTEQRAAEVQLLTEAFNQMSERLEKSFEQQRSFIADVSHELRTPLTAIHGQIDVVLLNPSLQNDTRQDILHVRAELRRLSRLVSNLLTDARAEMGILPQQHMHYAQSVELDSLLVDVSRQAHFLNPQVKLELGELQQASISGDVDLLRQLLLNILDNALHYTPSGGSVHIDLICTDELPDVIQAKSKNDEHWAKITICDTGPGIDPADIPHIFERHFRGQRTKEHSGSGLGLFIAHLIAEAHGGSILVESEPAKGSCFFIWLPTCAETSTH